MTDRFICIHGHFYQPPRENPWLESIELQDSAYPYHDWNERIASECYAPNMASRILDGEGSIIQIVNNYSKMSFNIGPTLLSWMEDKAPDVYKAILEADRESQKTFSGHGNAMAQAFNHMIMPLANIRDKHTQVLWGIQDFTKRFNRAPEGMWLPETAVNIETLEVLSEHGIKFTVLSPYQANKFRKLGTKTWKDAPDGSIDPSHPYLVNLPSGRSIAVYFYDAPIARGVAFEKLLSNGGNFANRLLSAFSSQRTWTQLVHIATDGETFGHHHRYGEMAVSYALNYLETNKLAQITNYGEFLEKFPPTHEVELYENTSWSCFHGVERWRSNCGCNAGAPSGWNQNWRAPLRESLDWMRDILAPKYEEKARQYLRDPWGARNDYIQVLLERTPENCDQFFERNTDRPLSNEEKSVALKLLEMQRYLQFMYTSCGWFFNDLSNIETLQILEYAGRALQIAQEIFGDHLQDDFLNRLAHAKSNIPEFGNGKEVFERFVVPSMVTLEKVGAHYALTSLFQTYDESSQIYCYSVDCDHYQLLPEGKARLALGRARITSNITGESKRVIFTALYLGDHNLTGATQEFQHDEHYNKLMQSLTNSFELGDLPAFFRVVDQNFGGSAYTLKALFKDEQRNILGLVLDSTLKEAEAAYRQLYEHHAPLMRFLTELNMPLPKAFYTAAEFALNTSLREALEDENPDLDKITLLLEEAKRSRIALDEEGLSFSLEKTINRIADKFQRDPAQLPLLLLLELMVDLASTPPLRTNFWKTQNIYHELFLSHLPQFQAQAEKGEQFTQRWVKHFLDLGEKLKFKK